MKNKTTTTVIISTGLGPLHLVEAARSLKQQGFGITLIQGWIPRYLPAAVVNAMGKLVGRDQLARRLKRRIPEGFAASELKGCGFADFATQFLFMVFKKMGWPHYLAASWGWRIYGRQSRRYLKSASIFHVRSGGGQGGAIVKARRSGAKVIVDQSIAHPKFISEILSPLAQYSSEANMITKNHYFWQDCVLRDCEMADVILVNSAFVRETFVAAGFDAQKIAVIHLGVREDFIGLKRDWSLHTPVRLIFTGAFGLRKGALDLIATLEILREREVKFELHIYGHVEQVLQARLSELPNVICHGTVLQDELKTALSEADIYVFPSLAEGCAQSVMEALAAGLPVIATPNSGAPIRDGESGLLVPVHAPEMIAEKIETLIDNSDLRSKLGINSQQLISANYTWADYSRALTKLYMQLVKS